jgi:hypothetical protein
VRIIAVCAIAAAAAFSTGCARATQGGKTGTDPTAARMARGYGPEVQRDVARLRAVTARFQTLDSAVAAGYPREVARCFDDPHHGAMGFHHVNRAFVDSQVEVDRPEILLYERTGHDRYTLSGVEYIIPYTRWPRNAAVAPTIMGQPLQRADDLKIWYLHVWAWKPNPEGLFADWNPKVHCP